VLKNVNIKSVEKAYDFSNVKNVRFDQVLINGEEIVWAED
jgi:hypothetical protein